MCYPDRVEGRHFVPGLPHGVISYQDYHMLVDGNKDGAAHHSAHCLLHQAVPLQLRNRHYAAVLLALGAALCWQVGSWCWHWLDPLLGRSLFWSRGPRGFVPQACKAYPARARKVIMGATRKLLPGVDVTTRAEFRTESAFCQLAVIGFRARSTKRLNFSTQGRPGNRP